MIVLTAHNSYPKYCSFGQKKSGIDVLSVLTAKKAMKRLPPIYMMKIRNRSLRKGSVSTEKTIDGQ